MDHNPNTVPIKPYSLYVVSSAAILTYIFGCVCGYLWGLTLPETYQLTLPEQTFLGAAVWLFIEGIMEFANPEKDSWQETTSCYLLYCAVLIIHGLIIWTT